VLQGFGSGQRSGQEEHCAQPEGGGAAARPQGAQGGGDPDQQQRVEGGGVAHRLWNRGVAPVGVAHLKAHPQVDPQPAEDPDARSANGGLLAGPNEEGRREERKEGAQRGQRGIAEEGRELPRCEEGGQLLGDSGQRGQGLALLVDGHEGVAAGGEVARSPGPETEPKAQERVADGVGARISGEQAAEGEGHPGAREGDRQREAASQSGQQRAPGRGAEQGQQADGADEASLGVVAPGDRRQVLPGPRRREAEGREGPGRGVALAAAEYLGAQSGEEQQPEQRDQLPHQPAGRQQAEEHRAKAGVEGAAAAEVAVLQAPERAAMPLGDHPGVGGVVELLGVLLCHPRAGHRQGMTHRRRQEGGKDGLACGRAQAIVAL